MALGATVLTTTGPAVAAGTPLTLLRAAPDDAAASVLGLDSTDNKTGRKLTVALRKAFANRGLAGGEEISLDEMRLTMGCTNDEASCLSEGGKMLGVRRLVFGYLRATNGTYQLDIQILDVDAGSFQAQESIELTKAQLSADNIDATATDIVNTLMPPEEADTDLPPRTSPLPEVEEEEIPAEPDPPREKGIYFGLQKPKTPKWKWAAFGTSLGLTALAGGTTIGMAVWLTANRGGFRRKLIRLSEESLTDTNDFNDVDPNSGEGANLCEEAETVQPGPNGPVVTNGLITQHCRNAEDVQEAQRIVGITTAVFGVATLAFTAVLLVHKRKPMADAMLRHNVTVGLGPSSDGGISLGGGLRF